MRAETQILIVISLLFLAGTVAANIPDTVTITSDKPYYLYPGIPGQTSTITVVVENTTPGYSGTVGGADVTFSVNDPALGTLNPVTIKTDTSGKATSTFTANTKSGFAYIRANVSYTGATGLYNFTTQKIDHDKAKNANFTHPLEWSVATEVPDRKRVV